MLPNLNATYSIKWYNPRTGEWAGDGQTIKVTDSLTIEGPPSDPELDWVVWVQKT